MSVTQQEVLHALAKVRSPRGVALAYSHDADLYVATLGDRVAIRRLTRGGVPDDLLNGTLDWVYPEELDIKNGFRWSPDGTRIAYLTMDERRVTDFPIVDFLTINNQVDNQRYPLAGQANPRVTLRVVDLASGIDRLVYDAQTTSGGSGGPLFNDSGKVIGVNFAILSGFSGSNFAVPISRAAKLLGTSKSEKTTR